MPNEPRLYEDILGGQEPYDGRRPLSWRISSYAIAIRDSALLMVEPAWAKRWELPGGGVELETEETLTGGAQRECWEETGFHFTPTGAPVFIKEMNLLLRENGTFHHSLIFVVRGTVGSQPDPTWLRDRNEITSVRWIPLHALANEKIHHPHREALQKLNLL